MFDIGFPELLVIAIVGLLVIGPERLPEALRTLGLWIGRLRRSFTNVKTEIEKEIGMDEIRRQLHNEAVMEEMRRIERDVRDSVNSGEHGEARASRRGAGAQPNRSGDQSDGGRPAEAGSPATGVPEGSLPRGGHGQTSGPDSEPGTAGEPAAGSHDPRGGEPESARDHDPATEPHPDAQPRSAAPGHGADAPPRDDQQRHG